MIATYINRYKDKITFEENGSEVIMKGGEYMRIGYANLPNGESSMKTENPIINMVDPSGGPYINTGDNLKEFFRDNTDRIITGIRLEPKKVIFEIKQI